MEKIKKLIKFFKKEKIDGYIVPKNDEFFSEYTPSYKDRLNFISEFTGSYGFSLITKEKNYLFVDGRYTLQAFNQCGKKFKVVTFPERMPYQILKSKKMVIGFDPRLFTKKILRIFFKNKNCLFKPLENNLVDKIWKRKLNFSTKKFFILSKNSVGESHLSKVKKILSNLKKRNADYQFITSSENNAWLLNIRGLDTQYSPLPNCYILLDKNRNIKLFCDLNKISTSLKKKLKKVKFIDIELTGKTLSKINKKKFIIDVNTCSVYFENLISQNNKILNVQDPIYFLKSIKNKKEIENMKTTHIYDGIALTKYLFWLKRNFQKKNITEISGSNKLLNLRKQNRKFKFLSFPTISGTGPNGAIIHYKPTKKTDRKLKKGDIYLVDSGGQYEFGTTDVTRTISLNNSDKRIKNIFTRVLKGHIAVANFKLKEKTSGSNIDNHARKYLKQIGLNYAHGTGHGVGHFLNVHEGPHAISKNNKVPLKKGMIVSNEPGYYENKNFGIRIENLIYVNEKRREKFFENLTMVPIDKNLIDHALLNKNEKEWLNIYHKNVFKNLKNGMNNIEISDLKKACSAI